MRTYDFISVTNITYDSYHMNHMYDSDYVSHLKSRNHSDKVETKDL